MDFSVCSSLRDAVVTKKRPRGDTMMVPNEKPGPVCASHCCTAAADTRACAKTAASCLAPHAREHATYMLRWGELDQSEEGGAGRSGLRLMQEPLHCPAQRFLARKVRLHHPFTLCARCARGRRSACGLPSVRRAVSGRGRATAKGGVVEGLQDVGEGDVGAGARGQHQSNACTHHECARGRSHAGKALTTGLRVALAGRSLCGSQRQRARNTIRVKLNHWSTRGWSRGHWL